ncbi:MAG: hypothetical protein EHM81_11110, partial [Chloroflexi bacterium]
MTSTFSADMTGTNIGYIYLFTGYYDIDFLESPDTRAVDGVYYPQWSQNQSFTLKFSWDPTIFSISDGDKTVMALFKPQQYGAAAADA